MVNKPSDSVHDEVNEAKKKAEAFQQELNRVKALESVYPDLEIEVGRWNKKVYSSKTVNGIVDNYETRFNCGCCSDSPYEVWPYLETEFGRVVRKVMDVLGVLDRILGGRTV
jgi:hypothetical protein